MSNALKNRLKLFKKHIKGKILLHHVIEDIKKTSTFVPDPKLTEAQVAVRHINADKDKVTLYYKKERSKLTTQIGELNTIINSTINGDCFDEIIREESLTKELNKLENHYKYYCDHITTMKKQLRF